MKPDQSGDVAVENALNPTAARKRCTSLVAGQECSLRKRGAFVTKAARRRETPRNG